ncbi:polymorphic toxin type 44 domain-containing protein [Pelosinus baikalensis]|uniref:Polymorphic toxin type 44 domain-containing protein n=1 Tax=Pelosinus baikalensis TaxID=2892015 RepID=A0ABS8HKT2_9FIRM|nr:polymorphic toxin type 44 domain-containing protein [Pelosinus baikalensis]MCC5463786.1 polymorphic toxin type 44 domain-containing protein [Pelosinus baikalensis]
MGSQYAYAPKTPPGVSIDANVKEAREYAASHSRAEVYQWFYDSVKNGARWDFKQLGSEYQEFGNYHYGVIGNALEIPEQVLLRAAGWAQYRAGTSELGWGTFFGCEPYGDDPEDQEWIKRGIRDGIYFDNSFFKLDGSSFRIKSYVD